jgi:hypothetical protein
MQSLQFAFSATGHFGSVSLSDAPVVRRDSSTLGVFRYLQTPVAAAQLLDDADEVRWSHHAVDREMARQDLCDQCRARRLQPDDKNRIEGGTNREE